MGGKYSVCWAAPNIFGCVENPNEYECSDAKNMKIDEVYVTFNISCKCEWCDKNYPNLLQSTYKTGEY